MCSLCLLGLIIGIIGCSSESDTSSIVPDQQGGMSIANGGLMAGEMMAGEMMAGEMMAGEMMAGEMMAGEMMTFTSIAITVRVINGATGQGVSGMLATVEQGQGQGVLEGMTSTTGTVTLNVQAGQFYEILMTAPGYDDHVLYGYAGEEDFTQITFASAQSLTSQVFSLVNLTPSPDKAIVVIGLDRPDLTPAIGSGAEISPTSGEGLILVNNFPTLGTVLTSGALGFVFFANVDPGELTLSAVPLEGESCGVFPANQENSIQVNAEAGQVVIAAFTCQSESP